MADRDGGRSHLTFCREALGWGGAVNFDRLFAWGVRRYGREMPGYRSVAFCDHYFVGGRAETVAIRWAATAWLFATKCLV